MLEGLIREIRANLIKSAILSILVQKKSASRKVTVWKTGNITDIYTKTYQTYEDMPVSRHNTKK